MFSVCLVDNHCRTHEELSFETLQTAVCALQCTRILVSYMC